MLPTSIRTLTLVFLTSLIAGAAQASGDFWDDGPAPAPRTTRIGLDIRPSTVGLRIDRVEQGDALVRFGGVRLGLGVGLRRTRSLDNYFFRSELTSGIDEDIRPLFLGYALATVEAGRGAWTVEASFGPAIGAPWVHHDPGLGVIGGGAARYRLNDRLSLDLGLLAGRPAETSYYSYNAWQETWSESTEYHLWTLEPDIGLSVLF